MKAKSSRKARRGFTLIEVMLCTIIVALLASIFAPKFDLLLQKAYQSTAKNNLGSIRSALSLYYSDMEGHYPLAAFPNDFASNQGTSLTDALVPRYMSTVPISKLVDRASDLNGIVGVTYDSLIDQWKAASPVQDIYIFRGSAGPRIGIDRPFVYDPDQGLIYICNDNLDHYGDPFYIW